MTPYLLAADIAIGAGGSSTWERCACGLPTIALCLADNQREVIREGAAAGFLWGIERVPSIETLAQVLRSLAMAPGLVRHMSRQALSVTDARGARRVADILMPQPVAVRAATQEDARMIYEWRTSPTITAASRNPAQFSFEAHCEWLHKTLADPTRKLLIGVFQGRDMGVVRFDIDGHRAEVSIFLAPGTIGAGFGRALLGAAEKRLRAERPHVTTLVAWVRKDNCSSFQMFKHLGYSVRISRLEKEFA